jgi:SH3-like domain-containing protein
MSLTAPRACAEDAPGQEIANAKYQFIGKVSGQAVFVRAGASDNDYAVMRLDDGAKVTVVGERFGWLKIMPPDGAFCYVAKAWVEKHGDGTEGRATNSLNVRVGSVLTENKAVIATRLDPGAEVQIIGEADEYFKIKPPQGTYLFVKKEFIEPVQRIDAPGEQTPGDQWSAPAAGTPQSSPQSSSPNTEMSATPTTNPASIADSATPSTQPSVAMAAPQSSPTTAPAVATTDLLTQDEAAFDQLQTKYVADSQKPMDQQDPATLLAGYQKLASDRVLPESLLQTTDQRVVELKARQANRQEYLATQKEQAEAKAKLMALQSESQELRDRVAKTDITYYAAVGTLRPSSLQQGTTPLYRLTDPANGRTVVYLKSDDVKIGEMMGQFIGVKGTITDDSQLSLKVITPTSYEAVDQTKLYNGIAAQLVPPSLMPMGPAQASVGNP